MQYSRALKRLIREVLTANPYQETVHVLKSDVNEGLYRIGSILTDAPNLGIFFHQR